MLEEEIVEKLKEINPLILNNVKFPHEISIKSDESIVTATDRQVEHVLLPELIKLLPESDVIGEETAPIDSEAVTDLFQSEYLWAVDPIDGTVNFAAGIPFFAVAVGLLKRDEYGYSVIAGAVSFPVFSEIYYTKQDKTFLINIISNEEKEVERIHAESVPVLLIPSSFQLKSGVDRKKRPAYNIRQLGCTAADLLFVSIGKASATLTSAHIWDFAASLAIAKTFDMFPRELSTGKIKTHFSKEDFLYSDPKRHWRLKEPIVLCEEKYFRDVQELIFAGDR